MRRHIVLVGLPGVGKSTVGRRAAQRLGAPFVDLDALIVSKVGIPVAGIFAELGEGRFRELEREAMRDVLSGPPAVISPGGGWAAQPGALEEARERAFIIYLKARAATATRRATSGRESRPLLQGQDPGERMRGLLQAREPFYRLADAEVVNDARPLERAVAEVVALARERAGWA